MLELSRKMDASDGTGTAAPDYMYRISLFIPLREIIVSTRT